MEDAVAAVFVAMKVQELTGEDESTVAVFLYSDIARACCQDE